MNDLSELELEERFARDCEQDDCRRFMWVVVEEGVIQEEWIGKNSHWVRRIHPDTTVDLVMVTN